MTDEDALVGSLLGAWYADLASTNVANEFASQRWNPESLHLIAVAPFAMISNWSGSYLSRKVTGTPMMPSKSLGIASVKGTSSASKLQYLS